MKMLQSFDPATGYLLGELPIASPDVIESTIETAHHIQQTNWSLYSLYERVSLVQKAYLSLQPFQEGIAQLLSMEMGKDLGRSRKEVRGTFRSGPYYAQEAAQAFEPQSLACWDKIRQYTIHPLVS